MKLVMTRLIILIFILMQIQSNDCLNWPKTNNSGFRMTSNKIKKTLEAMGQRYPSSGINNKPSSSRQLPTSHHNFPDNGYDDTQFPYQHYRRAYNQRSNGQLMQKRRIGSDYHPPSQVNSFPYRKQISGLDQILFALNDTEKEKRSMFKINDDRGRKVLQPGHISPLQLNRYPNRRQLASFDQRILSTNQNKKGIQKRNYFGLDGHLARKGIKRSGFRLSPFRRYNGVVAVPNKNK